MLFISVYNDGGCRICSIRTNIYLRALITKLSNTQTIIHFYTNTVDPAKPHSFIRITHTLDFRYNITARHYQREFFHNKMT